MLADRLQLPGRLSRAERSGRGAAPRNRRRTGRKLVAPRATRGPLAEHRATARVASVFGRHRRCSSPVCCHCWRGVHEFSLVPSFGGVKLFFLFTPFPRCPRCPRCAFLLTLPRVCGCITPEIYGQNDPRRSTLSSCPNPFSLLAPSGLRSMSAFPPQHCGGGLNTTAFRPAQCAGTMDTLGERPRPYLTNGSWSAERCLPSAAAGVCFLPCDLRHLGPPCHGANGANATTHLSWRRSSILLTNRDHIVDNRRVRRRT